MGAAFEKVGVEAEVKGLQQYKNAANQVQDANNKMGKSAQSIGTKFNNIANSIVSKMKWMALGVAAAFAGASIMGLKTAADLEQTALAYEVLLGSAKAAKDRMAELVEFAAKTPFEMAGIIKADRLLQTFGARSTENLKMVGDAAAGVGAPIEDIAFWVGRAYTAIQAGLPFGEASMRLMELGLLTGQARLELDKLTESGAGADEIFGVLQRELGRFGGLMEKQSLTLGGLVSTIKDSFNLMMAAVMKPFLPIIKKGIAAGIELIESKQKDIEAFAVTLGEKLPTAMNKFGSFVKDVVNTIKLWIGVILKVVETLKNLLSTINSIIPIVDLLKKFFDPKAVAVFTAAVIIAIGALVAFKIAAIAAALVNPFTAIMLGIALLTIALYKLVENWDKIWAGLQAAPARILEWLKSNWVDVVVGIFVPGGLLYLIVKHWEDIWNKLPEPAQKVLDRIGDMVEAFANAIIGTFEWAINEIISGINRLTGMAEGLINLIPGVDVDLGIGKIELGKVSGIMEYDPAKEKLRNQLKKINDLYYSQFDEMNAHEVQRIKDLADSMGDAGNAAAGAGDDFEDTGGAAAGAAEKAQTAFEKLSEIIQGAIGWVDDLYSAFSKLFGKPSREQAQLDYQLAQLKARRAQMVATGARESAVDSIDKEIQRLEQVSTWRQAEVDLMKAKLTLADQTLLTDAEQQKRAQDLTTAMWTMSDAAANVIGKYWSQAQAMLNWNEAMQLWTQNLIGVAVPHFQFGGTVPGQIGKPQLIVAHGGEEIHPAYRAGMPAMLGSGSHSDIQLSPSFSLQGATIDQLRAAMHRMVNDYFGKLESQTGREGRVFSSGIG